MSGDPSDSPTAATTATTVGWREWVALPEIGVDWLKAKIDTGARTSSLHAFDLEEFARDGAQWVRFWVKPWQRSDEDAIEVTVPVHDVREVRSSNGQSESRYAVAMRLRLAGRELDTVVTLSNRDEMGFRMLIGREALAQGFLVDSAASYVGGRPKRAVRKKNWGR